MTAPMKREREVYRNRIELLQGTLDMLILQTLQLGAQHGYGINQALRTRSGEVLQVETGSLYPALHRMERQKWIAAEWRVDGAEPAGALLQDHGRGAAAAGERPVKVGHDGGGDRFDSGSVEQGGAR